MKFRSTPLFIALLFVALGLAAQPNIPANARSFFGPPSYGGTWTPDVHPQSGRLMRATNADAPPFVPPSAPAVTLNSIRWVQGNTYFVPIVGTDDMKSMDIEVYADGKLVSLRRANIYVGTEWKESPSLEIPLSGTGGHRIEIYQLTNYAPSRRAIATGNYLVPACPEPNVLLDEASRGRSYVTVMAHLPKGMESLVREEGGFVVWSNFPGLIDGYSPENPQNLPKDVHIERGLVVNGNFGRQINGLGGMWYSLIEYRIYMRTQCGGYVASAKAQAVVSPAPPPKPSPGFASGVRLDAGPWGYTRVNVDFNPQGTLALAYVWAEGYPVGVSCAPSDWQCRDKNVRYEWSSEQYVTGNEPVTVNWLLTLYAGYVYTLHVQVLTLRGENFVNLLQQDIPGVVGTYKPYDPCPDCKG